MIRLYRNLSDFNMEDIIYDNEEFFNTVVMNNELHGDFLDVMKEIDNAIVIDNKLGSIRTPYGVCNRKNLSTGCKTVLNLIYIYRHKEDYSKLKALNGTECGWNALEVLFKYADKYKIDIGIIVEHLDNLDECSERDYLIDDKIKTRKLDLFALYS